MPLFSRCPRAFKFVDRQGTSEYIAAAGFPVAMVLAWIAAYISRAGVCADLLEDVLMDYELIISDFIVGELARCAGMSAAARYHSWQGEGSRCADTEPRYVN